MPYNVHYRDGTIITSPSGGVYLVDNGVKRPFPDQATFLSSYSYDCVYYLSNLELSLIPDGAPMQYNTHYRDGKLITAPSLGVYLVENGKKRAFPNDIIFISQNYKWDNVILLSKAEMSLIPDGIVMTYNVNYRNGQLIQPAGLTGIYKVENGQKRPFPSSQVFLSYSYKWTDVVTISTFEASSIPDGSSM